MGRLHVRLAGAALLVLLLCAAPGAADEADDACVCRDLVVTCTVKPSTVIMGNFFELCATVKSVGAVPLEKIKLTLRGCPKAKPHPDAKLAIEIPKLAQGESHTHCAKFECVERGACEMSAHAVDSTNIAAAGCICQALCKGLPALQLEMIDTALDRSRKGIFRLGEEFLYRMSVENDVGTMLTPDLRVAWSLPPELEFVRGRADGGVTISGAGQAATSSRFVLRPNQKFILEIVCKVKSVPPRALVQTRAVVVADPSGEELAEESESTTLQR